MRGPPAVPVGTEKIEAVKELAEALAIFCVLFNCSKSITAFQMPTSFRRLAQAGACGCFGDFNRINVEVLSVIAKQFNCIHLRCARA
jgi:dynein heavy chain